MAPSLEASGESTGGGEIRVSEGMFEGELDLGVQIRIRVPSTDTRSLLRRRICGNSRPNSGGARLIGKRRRMRIIKWRGRAQVSVRFDMVTEEREREREVWTSRNCN